MPTQVYCIAIFKVPESFLPTLVDTAGTKSTVCILKIRLSCDAELLQTQRATTRLILLAMDDVWRGRLQAAVSLNSLWPSG